MNNFVDVTAIIPYYNASSTIERAVLSVINQTLIPKQIIIVDDCSNDENRKYLDIFNQNELVEIIYLKKNGGPGVARNEGIMHARFDYIAFLDSDDIWSHNKIEVQYNIMVDDNLMFSCHESGIYSGQDLTIRGEYSYFQMNKYRLLFKNIVKTRTVMIHRKIFGKMIFNDKLRYSEDYYYWLMIISAGYKLYYIKNLFSFSFGDELKSGLSSNYKKMFYGEIFTLWHQKVSKNIMLRLLLVVWGLAKYYRRIIIYKIIKNRRKI